MTGESATQLVVRTKHTACAMLSGESSWLRRPNERMLAATCRELLAMCYLDRGHDWLVFSSRFHGRYGTTEWRLPLSD